MSASLRGTSERTGPAEPVTVGESFDALNRLSGVTSRSSKSSKGLLSMSPEELSGVGDDSLLSYMRNCVQNIKLARKILWHIVEEKRTITREFLRRRTNHEWSAEEMALIVEKIRAYNEFLRVYVESAEEDNTLTVNVMENALDECTLMSHFQEDMERSEALTENEADWEERAAASEEEEVVKRAQFAREAEQSYQLLDRLSKITPDFRQRVSARSNISSDYVLESLRNEKDELRENGHLLRRCLANQTRVIAELSLEVRRLKEHVQELEEGAADPGGRTSYAGAPELDGPFSRRPSSTLAARSPMVASVLQGIEPLRHACNLYAEEFRRSVKTLERLVSAAKGSATGDVDSHGGDLSGGLSGGGDLSGDLSGGGGLCGDLSGDLEEEVFGLAGVCAATAELLRSLIGDGAFEAQGDIVPGGEASLGAALRNVESVRVGLQHILARLCCDESTV